MADRTPRTDPPPKTRPLALVAALLTGTELAAALGHITAAARPGASVRTATAVAAIATVATVTSTTTSTTTTSAIANTANTTTTMAAATATNALTTTLDTATTTTTSTDGATTTPADGVAPQETRNGTVTTTQPAAARHGADAAPHIFVFMADDLNYNDLGFQGNRHVHTPNIDGFAQNGVEFTRMYTPIASCAPSRAAFHTGRHPFNNGVYMNHGATWANVTTLPMYLRELGYHVALGGKTHLAPESQYPYEYFGTYYDIRVQLDSTVGKFSGEEKLFLQHLVDIRTNETRTQGFADKPWFILYASQEPHGPHLSDKFAKIGAPGAPASSPGWVPSFPNASLPPKWPDNNHTRSEVTGYYNDINKLDRQFEYFLKVVREKNFQGEKAVTIFTSDHGGKYFSKWGCYESGLRVPFFMQLHGMPSRMLDPHRRQVGSLLSFVDVLPTFLELAGGHGHKKNTFDGSSFLDTLRRKGAEPPLHANHAYVYGVHTARGIRCARNPYPIRSIFDGRWKYIRNYNHQYRNQMALVAKRDQSEWMQWIKAAKVQRDKKKWVTLLECRPEEELYDTALDPHELRNLAGKKMHTPHKKLLYRALRVWMKSQGDSDPVATELRVPEHQSLEKENACLSSSLSEEESQCTPRSQNSAKWHVNSNGAAVLHSDVAATVEVGTARQHLGGTVSAILVVGGCSFLLFLVAGAWYYKHQLRCVIIV